MWHKKENKLHFYLNINKEIYFKKCCNDLDDEDFVLRKRVDKKMFRKYWFQVFYLYMIRIILVIHLCKFGYAAVDETNIHISVFLFVMSEGTRVNNGYFAVHCFQSKTVAPAC